MTVSSSPVHVDAALDPQLRRWLWLVKWFLAIPHVVLLVLLWAAFTVLSVVAFFAILLTGRYPRPVFDFNVGVLRWTWRVAFYTYGVLGTDRYPPFTLDEVDDYPAHLRVDYPDHLSRGLVLVKWWLLAIPHYLVVGLFLGGGLWLAGEAEAGDRPWVWGSGLVGLLVLFAAVALLFTGRYPQPIFDLVLGMQRWVLRVAAYAALLTDTYPPFRLDLGGAEPSSADLSRPSRAPERPSGWTAGRTTAVVVGSLVTLLAFGTFAAAGTTLLVDRVIRDDAGFVAAPEQSLSTSTYALTSDPIAVHTAGVDLPERLFGQARLRATSTGDVFVGVASVADARRYLDDVAHTTVTGIEPGVGPVYRDLAGDRRPSDPAAQPIWVAQAAGAGTQSLTWTPQDGDWMFVVMNLDGTPGIEVDADVAARLPVLGWVSAGLFVVAVLFLAGGLVLVLAAVPRTSREQS